jgi:hypothetical protein
VKFGELSEQTDQSTLSKGIGDGCMECCIDTNTDKGDNGPGREDREA